MIRLRSLGESVIEVRGGRIGPESEVLFAALLYLLVARGRRIPRSVLFELFWPGRDEQARRHCARQLLYRLRQLGVPLEGDSSGVLVAAENAELDYEAVLASGPEALDVHRPALVFLPGYSPRVSPRYDEWLEEHRGHVHGRLRKALLRRMGVARIEARWADVEALARQCLSCDPLNEEATLALAEATALGGSKTRALAIIDRYLRELGSDSRDIRVPATVLRRRIVDHLPGPGLSGTTETQFVGRDASMAMLADLLRNARSGSGRACVVEGPAGLGKSRLAAEFSAAAALQGVNVRRVVCQESDRERPLSAFADLVPSLLSLRGAAGCSPESLGYLRRLTDLDTAAERPSEAAHEAEFLAARIRQSLFDLIDAVASERCLLLVIDNAHRLDAVSWKVLREMFEWVRCRQILVLLTVREVPAGVLGEAALDGTIIRHRLGPLSDVDASAVFTTFIERHGTAVREDHRAWCVRVAEGSPFYLRELASHWLTTRETESLPASLSGLIEARLSSLTQPALRVLQVCAVLGKNATTDRLQRVLQYPRHTLVDAFDELQGGGFLIDDAERLSTRHDLLSTGALERSSTVSRAVLHKGAGEVLEIDAEASHSPGLLWDCAQQWDLAGQPARAVAVARRCARYLIEVGEPLQAAQILEGAMAFQSDRADSAAMLREQIYALRLAGQWKQIHELAHLLGKLGDPHDTTSDPSGGDALVFLESGWRNGYRLPELIVYAAAYMAEPNRAVSVRAKAGVWALIFADNMFAECEAIAVHTELSRLRLLGADQTVTTEGETIFHCTFGNLDESVHAAKQMLAMGRLSSTPMALCRELRYAAAVHLIAGLVDDAYSLLIECVETADRFRLATAAAAAMRGISNLLLTRGDLDDANQWYLQSCNRLGAVEDTVGAEYSVNLGARLALAKGDASGAERFIASLQATAQENQSLRARASAAGIALGMRLLRGRIQIDDPLLEEVTILHEAGKRYAFHDYSALALHRALESVGRPSEANEQLAAYVACRRERYPLPMHLIYDAR